MFCPKCGTQNKDDARFCATCGNPMSTNPEPTTYTPPAPTAPAVSLAYPQPKVTPAPLPGKGLGIAAMIVGIASLTMFCYWFLSLPGAIVGLVLGAKSSGQAKSVGRKNGMATAGIVCSSIALGLSVVWMILFIIGIASAGAVGYDYPYYY